MAHHSSYNTMGYNQRGPMAGMSPAVGINNFNNMGNMGANTSMMSSMGNSIGNSHMNHMMMGNGNNMNGIGAMTGMSHMNGMQGSTGMMNGSMNPNTVPMGKMAMQQQSQLGPQTGYSSRRMAPYPNPAMHASQKRMSATQQQQHQQNMAYSGTNNSGYGNMNPVTSQQYPTAGYPGSTSRPNYPQQQQSHHHPHQQSQLQAQQHHHMQQQFPQQQPQQHPVQMNTQQMNPAYNNSVATGGGAGSAMIRNSGNAGVPRQQPIPNYGQQTSQYYHNQVATPAGSGGSVMHHQQQHHHQQPHQTGVVNGPGVGPGNPVGGPGQYMGPHHGSNSAYGNVGPSGPAYVGNQGMGTGATVGAQYPGQVQSNANMSYQHSPVPGNPTPPLTPASNIPPYVSPSQESKGGVGNFNMDIKPMLSKEEELRLTFPVRDGIILPPFRLEHNLAVSNHAFHLKSTVYQTLMWRPDLELQLKCFHHEDRTMGTNWPASVQVSVNATPLVIDRGENKSSHKPLYLKDVCQSGRNTIQITVSACCCSHLFVLQLVHRPSVQSVLQGLLRKRLLSTEHSVNRIKRHFNNGLSNNGGLSGDKDVIEQTSIKVPLKCPITYKRITLPARGQDCKHTQCFDLESYLQLNCERGNWRCPVCTKPAQLEGLEVDQYVWAIINDNPPDVEEVTIDSQANWKAKRCEDESRQTVPSADPSAPGKRLSTKAMSPGSTSMPTMNSWMEAHQAMSPYMPPDMNSIVSGSMMSNSPSQQQNSPYGNRSANNPEMASMSGNTSGGSDFSSHLGDTTNPLDHLTAIDKSLGDQMPHTPHTPHTPGNAGGNSGPPSVNPSIAQQQQDTSGNNLNASTGSVPDTSDIIPADLNFDPAAVIEGEAAGQENINLLPNEVLDPTELLSYFDPPDLNTPPSSGASSGNPSSHDDLLALFAE